MCVGFRLMPLESIYFRSSLKQYTTTWGLDPPFTPIPLLDLLLNHKTLPPYFFLSIYELSLHTFYMSYRP